MLNKFNTLLEVRDISFDYPDKGFLSHKNALLEHISFSVSPGSILHIRGNNGSGKTTLLKLLAGLLEPSNGIIQWKKINDNTASLPLDPEHLCYVGHKTGISQALTVMENLKFDLRHNHNKISLNEALHKFALDAVKDISCGLISAGMRRRVGLVRLMLSDAMLWLLDEPLVALDKDAINCLMTCLQEHMQKGGLVVLTSHQSLPINFDSYQEYCL